MMHKPVPLHPVADSIESDYRQRTPHSLEYHKAAQAYLPGGDTRTITFFPPYPLYIVSAQGAVMTDADSNTYHDFLGNYTSTVHGHNHPELTRAIAEQAAMGTAYGACAPVQIDLAREICRRVPSVDHVRFCNSGTEATMNALRAARAYTGRTKILKVEGGYHGSHDLAEISVAPPLEHAGDDGAPVPVAEEPGIPDTVLQDVVITPLNDMDVLEAVFVRHGHELAAVIIEPMLGAGGTIPASGQFLSRLRALCDHHGALLIFDEVITFRLAEGGMQEIYGVYPDLTAFGKIIGGGLPVGAFGGRKDIMSLFAPPGHRMVQSGTYNANPLTMAAGLKALLLLTGAEIARINMLGEKLSDGLRSVLDEMQVHAQVTGQGSLHTLHFTPQPVTNYRSMASKHAELHRLLHLGLINRGIFTAKRGMFAVSTAMNDANITTFVESFADLLGVLKPYIAETAPDLLA